MKKGSWGVTSFDLFSQVHLIAVLRISISVLQNESSDLGKSDEKWLD